MDFTYGMYHEDMDEKSKESNKKGEITYEEND